MRSLRDWKGLELRRRVRIEAWVRVRIRDIDELLAHAHGAGDACVLRNANRWRAVCDPRPELLTLCVVQEERRAVDVHQLLRVRHDVHKELVE